jgi:hypothetical protein
MDMRFGGKHGPPLRYFVMAENGAMLIEQILNLLNKNRGLFRKPRNQEREREFLTMSALGSYNEGLLGSEGRIELLALDAEADCNCVSLSGHKPNPLVQVLPGTLHC